MSLSDSTQLESRYIDSYGAVKTYTSLAKVADRQSGPELAARKTTTTVGTLVKQSF